MTRDPRPPWRAALAAALLGLAAAVVAGSPEPADPRPNVILVVTDDQTADSLFGDPPAMPWLRTQLADPSAGWTRFSQAIAATPMCCPSRASLLTGLVAERHGVTSNEDGEDLDETDTLATWLHDAGYTTGLVGKYLNGYPWDRGPYVPPGWDRWFAKTNDTLATTYLGYGVVDQGRWRRYGRSPADYVTDVLGREAVGFVRSAPPSRPWFLYLAPPAGHEPWTPAPRHEGTLAGGHVPEPSEAAMNDVDGLAPWIRALPALGDDRSVALSAERVRARETLLAVDEWLAALWRTVVARGEQDRTVIVLVSDNGFQFGEHRWVGKQTPFEPSLRIPFLVRSPWVPGGVEPGLVSTIDVAPTIAALAGLAPPLETDGLDLADAIRGTGAAPEREAVPISWGGGDDVPAWSGFRLPDRTLVTWADGRQETYVFASDPEQLDPIVGPWRVSHSVSGAG